MGVGGLASNRAEVEEGGTSFYSNKLYYQPTMQWDTDTTTHSDKSLK
jgi:hypothetical protein